MIKWLVGLVLLPACAMAAWMIARDWLRRGRTTTNDGPRRREFRLRREQLEWEFLRSLAVSDPVERLRWEDAAWDDTIVWARERSSRRLLALVLVEFRPDPENLTLGPDSIATAVFSHRHGIWTTEGQFLRDVSPAETFRRDGRLEPIFPPGRESEADRPMP